MEFETFYDTVKLNNKTLFISIPKKISEYAGFKKGDKVKVMIKIIQNEM